MRLWFRKEQTAKTAVKIAISYFHLAFPNHSSIRVLSTEKIDETHDVIIACLYDHIVCLIKIANNAVVSSRCLPFKEG